MYFKNIFFAIIKLETLSMFMYDKTWSSNPKSKISLRCKTYPQAS